MEHQHPKQVKSQLLLHQHSNSDLNVSIQDAIFRQIKSEELIRTSMLKPVLTLYFNYLKHTKIQKYFEKYFELKIYF